MKTSHLFLLCILVGIPLTGFIYDKTTGYQSSGSAPSTESDDRCRKAQLAAEIVIGEAVDSAAEVEYAEKAIREGCG